MLSFSQEKNLEQAPFNPQFLEFMQKYYRGEYYPWTEEGNYIGYIPPPLDLSHLQKSSSKSEYSNLFYPATYDLRNYGKMTPVRNQGSCGSCWAFATYGSLESTLLTAENRDFSENHLKNTHGFDWTCCAGGNEYISMAYLSRWSGPWNETDDPYNPSSCTSATNKPVQKHLQNAFFIPKNITLIDSIPDIKYAIMNYGAVKASYYHSDTYYNSTYKSYYYNGTNSTNHAVTIAGWDDTFSRTKFNIQPPGDGAFLVKNSWGTSWGASGYFYLSYYDKSLSGFTIFFGESVFNFDYIYQYDPLGWVSSLGYSSETAWFSNIFTSTSSQYLLAVSFYVASPNSSYEIYVYTNANSGPRSGTLSGTKTGTIENAGYNTILLNSPIYLSSGQKFSVVIKLTTPGYNYPIPIEYAYSGYSSGASASPGQSYISYNGTSWQDITTWNSTANVCLKAFSSNTYPGEVPENSVKVYKSGSNQIKITWGAPSCGGATNYTIYEGNLDQLLTSGYNHYSKVCSDSGGDRSETFTPSTSNSYYIVVPKTSLNVEGSYSFGRPKGLDIASCGIQYQIPFDCP
ncbi:MAG: lectin like domain-containing protein [Thermoanaerobaculia bacterium]